MKKQWKIGNSRTMCNFTEKLSLPKNIKNVWKTKNCWWDNENFDKS